MIKYPITTNTLSTAITIVKFSLYKLTNLTVKKSIFLFCKVHPRRNAIFRGSLQTLNIAILVVQPLDTGPIGRNYSQ